MGWICSTAPACRGSVHDPFWLTGGKVYLTGPYVGAPFGLSIVNPAKADPFNLGNVALRAAIYIDPHTAQATDTSDPFPAILHGVPFLIGHVNVSIDRPGLHVQPHQLRTDVDHGDDHGRRRR